MAAKIDEIKIPILKYYVNVNAKCYKRRQIREAEIEISFALEFNLSPPTLSMWLNLYISIWDIYITTDEFARENELIKRTKLLINFKKICQQSYILYLDIFQYLDAMLLTISIRKFKPVHLTTALLFLVLGKSYSQFTSQEIFELISDKGYSISKSN